MEETLFITETQLADATQHWLDDTTELVLRSSLSDRCRLMARLSSQVGTAEKMGFNVEAYKEFFVELISKMATFDRIRLLAELKHGKKRETEPVVLFVEPTKEEVLENHD